MVSSVQELLALPEADLAKKFEEVVKRIREGPPKANATNDEKLKIYGLYKQATVGDNNESQPWAVQMEKRAKWDAWTNEKGKSKKQSMADYIIEFERQS